MGARRLTLPPFRTFGWLVGLVACLVVGLFSPVVRAFTPPPLAGAVNDAAKLLTPAEHQELERILAEYRKAHGHEVVVFTVPSLAGESIEDVAFATFNSWGVGKKDKDNGVLLVVAPKDRKLRIESGKGVGGALTDLVSKRILSERVGPKLKVDKNFEALRDGVTSIHSVLLGGPVLPAGEDAGAPVLAVPRRIEPPDVPPTSLFVDTTGAFPEAQRARYLTASDAAAKKGMPLLAIIVVEDGLGVDAPIVVGANMAAFYRAFPTVKAIAVITREGRDLFVYSDLTREAQAEATALQTAVSRAKGVVGSAASARRPEVFVDQAIVLLDTLGKVPDDAWRDRGEPNPWSGVAIVVGILAVIGFLAWLVGKLGLDSGGSGGSGSSGGSSGSGSASGRSCSSSSSATGGGYSGGGGSSGGGGASDSY